MDEQLRRLVFWVLGGFYRATWDDVAIVVPATIMGCLLLWGFGWRLNILSLGANYQGVIEGTVVVAAAAIYTVGGSRRAKKGA